MIEDDVFLFLSVFQVFLTTRGWQSIVENIVHGKGRQFQSGELYEHLSWDQIRFRITQEKFSLHT